MPKDSKQLPERYVTKVAWDKLREPFRQVWSKESQKVEYTWPGDYEFKIKIYRIGKIVRIDIPDNGVY